jgi:hypothetical protein
MPAQTLACQINWTNGTAVASGPIDGANDHTLDSLIVRSQAVGIDAPFGWPFAFTEAVAEWTHIKWNEELRDHLRFRHTDQFVHDQIGQSPLSVSSDRIALPAMRAMALLRRFHVTDKSGDGMFFEVYPGGTLYKWGIARKGYKEKSEDGKALRVAILSKLRAEMPWLVASDEYAETDHALDALVASLAARAAFQGLTLRPEPGNAELARKEGWIHLPTGWPSPS